MTKLANACNNFCGHVKKLVRGSPRLLLVLISRAHFSQFVTVDVQVIYYVQVVMNHDHIIYLELE